MFGESSDDVLSRVLGATVAWDQDHDYWERSSAMTGLLAWPSESTTAAVRRWLHRAVQTQDDRGFLSYGERLHLGDGHIATFTPTAVLPASFGYPLLCLYDIDQDESLLAAAERQVAAVMATPRTSGGGFWSRAEGPELWIDMTYMLSPFLAKFAAVSGDASYLDEAYHQLLVTAHHVVDASANLGRHTWCEVPNHFPQSTFWARGNGWLVSAAVDMLEIAPEHPKAAATTDLLQRVLAAIAAYQERSGLLRNVLDNPYEPFEASGTLMFAYAAAKAHRLGLVEEEYVERAVRAVQVISGCVDEAGLVRDVVVPPGGPGVPFGSAAYGQGFYLLACDELRTELGLPEKALDGE